MKRRLVTAALILAALITTALLLSVHGGGHGRCPQAVRAAGLTCVSD